MPDLSSTSAPSPDTLTDKYRPLRIADFVGLDKPRRIATRLSSNPPLKGAFLFLGEPGIGKTTLALAMAHPTSLEAFGFNIVLSGDTATFTRIAASSAAYEDDKPRDWQGYEGKTVGDSFILPLVSL